MQQLIYKAAGKNKKAIWAIDNFEGIYCVWLKDGYEQENYHNTIINIEPDMSYQDIQYEFSIVIKTGAES